MSADFKGYGRSELLLEQLIPRYDNSLSQQMIIEANALRDKIQKCLISTEPKSFTIKDHHQNTAYWITSFTQPVIQYIHECLASITSNIRFHEYGHLEHVPCYIPNINHVVMFANYNNGEPSFSNNIMGGLFKIYENDSQLMELSSLNILLPNKAKSKFLDESVLGLVRQAFEYCYWRFPFEPFNNKSCINNLIYATTSRITKVISLRKTLVKIVKINRDENVFLLGKNLPSKTTEILMINEQDTHFFTKKCYAHILSNVLEGLEEGDIINAVLVFDQKFKNGILVIGKIGDIVNPNNITCVVSMVLAKKLQHIGYNSSPTKISAKSDVEHEVSRMLRSNYKMFDSIFWLDKSITKKITKSIEMLFPMFINIDDVIYQLSPTLLTFLVSFPDILKNRSYLSMIIRFFDTMQIRTNMNDKIVRRKLRFSNEYEKLQTNIPDLANKLLELSPRILNRMAYSRILSQYYEYWNYD